ncbi:MAG: hypothetical protein A3G73_09695 [Rhodospirillales bacterium RIFCSPLOWO2_12_FULL_67_15]|nr:MAG: hypothetical protein A3G73_09695 [Rhodospirillales bacterium RIFCSPLOWO2_12_FULL_67_15]
MTFKKKTAPCRLQNRRREADKLLKRRYCPRCDDGEFDVRYGFDSPVDYGYLRIRCARGLGEKRAFTPIALDQMNVSARHESKDQSGKSGAASDIRDLSRNVGNIWRELRGIQDMPPPHVGEGRIPHEIDRFLPLLEQFDEVLESFHRFRARACFAREILRRHESIV